MCRVSVIMGVYNANLVMLEKAINSILCQSYTDFEFIICDDGSSNAAFSELKKIEQKDSRICIIKNKKNKGLAYTLNKCIQYSKGEYIARMDADDISMRDRLEAEVNFLDNNEQYAFVGTNAYFIDEKIWGESNLPIEPTKRDMLFNSPFIHPTVMLRRRILKAVKGYRVESCTVRVEDYDLWMRLYAKNYIGYNIQDRLYEFRENSDTFGRRKYKYRLNEAIIRYQGFKNMGILLKGIIFIIKPLIVGLIPQRKLIILRRMIKRIK